MVFVVLVLTGELPNSGGRTPGSKLPASPPPLPRRNGGGQPGPVPVHRALHPPSNSRLCMFAGTSTLSMNCATSSTKASVVAHNGNATTCTANVDHLVNVLQLGKLCGETDHENLHLRHERDDDELHCGISTVLHRQQRRICTTCKQGHPPPRKVLRRSLYGLPNMENHGNRPLHHDRDVDDQR